MTNDPPKTIWVKNQRKDGKFTVVYAFPVSGVRLTKTRTREQIEAERTEYQIIGLPQEYNMPEFDRVNHGPFAHPVSE